MKPLLAILALVLFTGCGIIRGIKQTGAPPSPRNDTEVPHETSQP